MAGLVPAIHVLLADAMLRRGCPAQGSRPGRPKAGSGCRAWRVNNHVRRDSEAYCASLRLDSEWRNRLRYSALRTKNKKSTEEFLLSNLSNGKSCRLSFIKAGLAANSWLISRDWFFLILVLSRIIKAVNARIMIENKTIKSFFTSGNLLVKFTVKIIYCPDAG